MGSKGSGLGRVRTVAVVCALVVGVISTASPAQRATGIDLRACVRGIGLPPIGCPGPTYYRATVGILDAFANGDTFGHSMTPDGRYFAFSSYATNLLVGDTNRKFDIFVHDRQARQTTRVSVDSYGLQGLEHSFGPSISADGRYVAFGNEGSLDVETPAITPYGGIYVHDRQTKRTTLVSKGPDGAPPNDTVFGALVSADGRFVAYTSEATNLVPNDTNTGYDAFLYDRESGQTTRVSVASDGSQAQPPPGQFLGSSATGISADGRYIVLDSNASNLVPGDTNARNDVFIHDRLTPTTTMVSGPPTTTPRESRGGPITPDGRYVLFTSQRDDLIPADTNSRTDLFLKDLALGTIERVSVATGGGQANDRAIDGGASISPDGRYVSFTSFASNLTPKDTNNELDVFQHDRGTLDTIRVSMMETGQQMTKPSAGGITSADGRYVAFLAHGRVEERDTYGKIDVYVFDRSPDPQEPIVSIP